MTKTTQFGIKSAISYLERIVEICEDSTVIDLTADENETPEEPKENSGWALGVIWQKTRAAIEILERMD